MDPESAAAARMVKYGELTESLKIIVLSTLQREPLRLSERVEIDSTGSANKLRMLWDAYQLGRRVAIKENLVITAQNPFEVGLVAYWLARKLQAGLELQVHGDFFGSSWWQWHPPLNLLRYHLGLFWLKRARAVRAVSQRVKTSLRLLGIAEEKITVAPIFTPPRQANPDAVAQLQGLWEGQRVILGVGRLEPEKNFSLLIRAFQEIARQKSDVVLAIVGDGSEKNNLSALAARLGVTERVHFWGGQVDPAAYYAVATVLAVPSYFEGWGRVAIEALQAGCPVVMTDVGLAGEVVRDGENGLVVPVGDQAKLTAAIGRILGDPALAKRLAEKGRQTAAALPTEEEALGLIKKSWEKASHET